MSHKWKGFSCLGQTIWFSENRKTIVLERLCKGRVTALDPKAPLLPLEGSPGLVLLWRPPRGGGRLPPGLWSQNRKISRTSQGQTALKALTFSNPSGTNLYYIDTLLFSYPNLLLSLIKSCRLGSAMLWGIKGNAGPTQGMKWLKGWQCGHYIKMIIFSIDRLYKGNQQQKFWQCLTRKNRWIKNLLILGYVWNSTLADSDSKFLHGE